MLALLWKQVQGLWVPTQPSLGPISHPSLVSRGPQTSSSAPGLQQECQAGPQTLHGEANVARLCVFLGRRLLSIYQIPQSSRVHHNLLCQFSAHTRTFRLRHTPRTCSPVLSLAGRPSVAQAERHSAGDSACATM